MKTLNIIIFLTITITINSITLIHSNQHEDLLLKTREFLTCEVVNDKEKINNILSYYLPENEINQLEFIMLDEGIYNFSLDLIKLFIKSEITKEVYYGAIPEIQVSFIYDFKNQIYFVKDNMGLNQFQDKFIITVYNNCYER